MTYVVWTKRFVGTGWYAAVASDDSVASMRDSDSKSAYTKRRFLQVKPDETELSFSMLVARYPAPVEEEKRVEIVEEVVDQEALDKALDSHSS